MSAPRSTRWLVYYMTGGGSGLVFSLHGEHPSRAAAAASLRTMKGRVMRDQANQAYYVQTLDKSK